jgi:hypothetical protein
MPFDTPHQEAVEPDRRYRERVGALVLIAAKFAVDGAV